MPVRRTQNWLPSIFNDFFDNDWMVKANATAPAINVLETEKEYKVELAAPGMTKEDFNVRIDEENNLVITMEKKTENKEEKKEGRYLRREFSYSKFQQTILLPENVEKDKISAKVEHGILSIEIPKVKEEEKQKSKQYTLSSNIGMVHESEWNAPTPQKSYTQGVPYYNVDFIGGFDIVLNDQTTTPEYLINFQKYNEATCWCNVTGHSMEPEITHGDIIALKEIEDASFLPYGEVYAIITTNNMRTIKRIGPASNPDSYSLIPTNRSPEYGIQELPKNMIRHVFHVLGCMKRL